VGIGTASTLVYAFAVAFIQSHADRWFGDYWSSRGSASLIITLVVGVGGLLFILWQVYLLIRFAIAFGKAAKKLRREWKQADRALAVA